MTEESPKRAWVADLPTWPPLKDSLAPLVEQDHDEFETSVYESAADPEHVWLETTRRRYRGAFRRRARRRADET